MPTHQFSLVLISHQLAASVIQQREGDGYINATQLCAVAKRHWFNYVREENTGHFLRKLAEELQLPVVALHPELPVEGGKPETWVHPRVALHLAQWLSPDFAVKVSKWVHDWLSGKGAPVQAKMPYHLVRHMANLNKIPSTHFSILQEMTNTLIAPLEMNGYTLPEKLVPDISQGQMFCRYAREALGIETDDLPTYPHEYPDGRVVDAKLYPVEHLGSFRKYINEVWMPKRAQGYFRERDPLALIALDEVLSITYNPAALKLGPPKRRKLAPAG